MADSHTFGLLQDRSQMLGHVRPVASMRLPNGVLRHALLPCLLVGLEGTVQAAPAPAPKVLPQAVNLVAMQPVVKPNRMPLVEQPKHALAQNLGVGVAPGAALSAQAEPVGHQSANAPPHDGSQPGALRDKECPDVVHEAKQSGDVNPIHVAIFLIVFGVVVVIVLMVMTRFAFFMADFITDMFSRLGESLFEKYDAWQDKRRAAKKAKEAAHG